MPGCETVFPIRDNGIEMLWGVTPEEARERAKKGYIRATKHTPNKPQKFIIQYLMSGTIEDIDNGKIQIDGKNDDGSIIAHNLETKKVMPKLQWSVDRYDARDFGAKILKNFKLNDRFDYPKSLYAVHDCLKLFTADKPNALIVDFFAGSGTTLHAVNLLNAEDGRHRRCVCVTNNEVSADEQKAFVKKGLRQGDEGWEDHGIARYVTWPRTKCSIEGVDVNGEPLKGNYIGSDMPMSGGFKANAIFFDLTYESAWPIRLDNAFDAIAPILWMQAGAKGPIIHRVGKSYLTTDYYGVLFDYGQASKFCEKVKRTPSIKTIFVVTDDQRRYSNMCRRLPGVEVHRLYETFLKTFEICGEGGD